MKIGVTGHRPDKVGGYSIPNPTYDRIVRELESQLLSTSPEYVFTGMAIGVDQWVAELCVTHNIRFIAAVPFEGQEHIWPPSTQRRYHWLLERAAYVVIVSPGEYGPEKMGIRNRWIVDNVDNMLAVWDGSSGGTAHCFNYARQQGKPITRIHVDPLEVPAGVSYVLPPAPPALVAPTGLVLSDFSRSTIPSTERISRSQDVTRRAALLGPPSETPGQAHARRASEEATRLEARETEVWNRALERRVAQAEAIIGRPVHRGINGAISVRDLASMEMEIMLEASSREAARVAQARQNEAQARQNEAREERRRAEARRNRQRARRQPTPSMDIFINTEGEDHLLRLLEESVRNPPRRRQSAPATEAPKDDTPTRDPFVYKRMVDLDD